MCNYIKLDSNDKFWLVFWGILIAGIVAISFGIANYFDQKNTKIQELINAGHSPLEIQCAYDNNQYNPTCLALAIGKKKE